jgi:hypothetical protein
MREENMPPLPYWMARRLREEIEQLKKENEELKARLAEKGK